MRLKFEWNAKKATSNLNKHDASFVERVLNVIRIFSARRATKNEQSDYKENANYENGKNARSR